MIDQRFRDCIIVVRVGVSDRWRVFGTLTYVDHRLNISSGPMIENK
jgi:hypothetical protein